MPQFEQIILVQEVQMEHGLEFYKDSVLSVFV